MEKFFCIQISVIEDYAGSEYYLCFIIAIVGPL